MTAIQAAHPAEYKTAAKCVMDATTEDGVAACVIPLLGLMQH